MAEGRIRDEWSRTSSMMALIANCHRSKKCRLFRPSDFDPLGRRKNKEKLPRVGVSVLRDLFIKENKP